MTKNVNIKKTILEIVEKIRGGYNPDKIILFGSHTKGTSTSDSDIDLLVIKDSNHRRDERDGEIRRLLWGIKFPLDIFVYTPAEVEKFGNLKGSFVNEIFKSGEVMYERK